MFFIKIHKSLGNVRSVIAVCDSEILGKKFEDGKKQLDIRESFYNGEEASKERIVQIIRKQRMEDASFNIAGKESIKMALEEEIITKEGIHKIKGVPFALVLL